MHEQELDTRIVATLDDTETLHRRESADSVAQRRQRFA
jgi:hypothetical protein